MSDVQPRAGGSDFAPDTLSDVTVIVPAKNAARSIDACLAALAANLPGASREIIVVDNGSTDDTVQRARGHGVRVLEVPQGFVSRIRNEGARSASGGIVAFIDADCLVLPEWYDAVVTGLADPSVGIVGCRHEVPADATWCQSVWHEAQMRREAEGDRVSYVPAGNCAMRRELFLTLNGFDERLETGEDPDLCVRVAQRGYRVATVRTMRCIHLGEPATLAAVFRRERWHGRGARFFYAGGRVAAVTVATAWFGAAFIVGALALVGSVFGGWRWPILAIPLALLLPAAFAWRYGSSTSPWRLVQLWVVYSAYFFGRAASLPVVLRRTWPPARGVTSGI